MVLRLRRWRKCGLTFSSRRVNRMLYKGRYAERLSPLASIFLTGALEYLTTEVLEMSAKVIKEQKKKRITPRFIHLAVQRDPELKRIFDGITFANSGVEPHIELALLPIIKRGNVADEEDDERESTYNGSSASESESDEESDDGLCKEGTDGPGPSAASVAPKKAKKEDLSKNNELAKAEDNVAVESRRVTRTLAKSVRDGSVAAEPRNDKQGPAKADKGDKRDKDPNGNVDAKKASGTKKNGKRANSEQSQSGKVEIKKPDKSHADAKRAKKPGSVSNQS